MRKRRFPYVTKATITDETGLSASTVNRRIKELEQSERYPQNTVIHDGNIVLVNALCFLDWEINRQAVLSGEVVWGYDADSMSRTLGW